MHQSATELPVGQEGDGVLVRGVPDWGGQAVGFTELPAGLDMTPVFQGLPDDMCPAPHWGYVFRGALRVTYEDGSEEVARGGDVFYFPAGHTVRVDEDVSFVEFSPSAEMAQVMEHVSSTMG